MDPSDGAEPDAASTMRQSPGDRLRPGRWPHFFLSRAPGEDDIYIARLFSDLSAEIRSRLGPGRATEIGYLDPGGLARPSWPADAQSALATCHAFVAICSRRYFLSSHCGRSWSVFASRLGEHHRLTGQSAPALVPVVWSDSGRPFLDDLGVVPHPNPNAEEARVLSRLSSHRPAYQELVASLAERIVDTALRHRLPPAPPDLTVDTAADAFDRHLRTDRSGERARVSFAVVAGTREQMRPIRTNINGYGPQREDWAPYGPAAPEPVSERAVAVAAARRFGSELVPLEAVADRIGQARQRNEIVVLLVDAWATQLDELRAALRAMHDNVDDTTAVLVPTNYADPETAANRGVLRTAVLSAFAGRERRRDLAFHPEVGTPERFDADLAVAIAEAQRRLLRTGRSAPARPGPRPPARPILGGP